MVTQATLNKQVYALIDLYKDLFIDRYRRAPTLNRYKSKWAMTDVVEDIGAQRAEELLRYYFKTQKPGHPLEFFFYNYERINQVLADKEEDERKRAQIRKETAEKLREMENEPRSTSN